VACGGAFFVLEPSEPLSNVNIKGEREGGGEGERKGPSPGLSGKQFVFFLHIDEVRREESEETRS